MCFNWIYLKTLFQISICVLLQVCYTMFLLWWFIMTFNSEYSNSSLTVQFSRFSYLHLFSTWILETFNQVKSIILFKISLILSISIWHFMWYFIFTSWRMVYLPFAKTFFLLWFKLKCIYGNLHPPTFSVSVVLIC